MAPSPADASPTDKTWASSAAAFALAAVGSVASLQLAGPAQGVLFGGYVTASVLTPALAGSGKRSAISVTAIAMAAVAGCLVGPLLAWRNGDLNARVMLPAATVLAAITLTAGGLTWLAIAAAPKKLASPVAAAAVGVGTAWTTFQLTGAFGTTAAAAVVSGGVTMAFLMAVRQAASVAAWGVTFLLLVWLGWPIWLSPWLPGHEAWAEWLVPAHPLLAMDAVLTTEGLRPWTEHTLMYGQLTVLQQHVMYRPPQGVAANVWLHVGLATPMVVAAIAEVVRAARARSAGRTSVRPPLPLVLKGERDGVRGRT